MEKKQKITLSILSGFSFGFMIFFFGILEIFASNREEFYFSYADFAVYTLLSAIGATLLISVILMLLRGKAFYIVFGIVFWLTAMGFVQGLVLDIGIGSLMGDDEGIGVSTVRAVLNAVLWVATGAGCVFAALKMKKHEMITTVATIALITISGMQLVSCGMQVGTVFSQPKVEYISTDASGNEVETPKSYLTTEGIYEISGGKNVVVFILDRFDKNYYDKVVKSDEKFFDSLDGFTYFGDNVSLYARTYPAVVSMISGIDTDFTSTAEEYFQKAYSTSPFLTDLKENDYKIKIYTGDYYGYCDASALGNFAENISGLAGYTVNNRGELSGNMMLLSLYRYLPTALKRFVTISSQAFVGLVDYKGDAPEYDLVDYKFYEGLKENRLTEDESENSFIYIHLNGCHSPYSIDENGNKTEKGNTLGATKGSFKIIFDYIDEMKRLGVYDDATIIITGDHPAAINDSKEPSEPRLTALLVKPSGSSGTPLAYSKAQVAQENFIPTIIKSAGIETENDYGLSYFEIPENENRVRTHKFQQSGDWRGKDAKIIEFRISGDGTDFSNWEKVDEYPIGNLYK